MVGPPSQPGQSVPSPGDVLRGKYRIERILGRGGMGVVALAHHLRLDHPVAIKVLRPNPTEPHAAERFAREARAAAKLHGEHVVRILDVDDSESGLPFIVMEYLEGTDLEKIVKDRGGLPVPEAVEYVLQACEGVAEAHAAGIVHRDLKPSNLFLVHRQDGSPCVKLVDFGISKPLEATDEMALTDTEWVVGSPMYMAPEQLRSARDVDLRTDVWALGLVLYRLLTGKHAFEAESRPAVILRIAAEAPTPIERLRPDVPPALGEIILRCLAKDRNARFARVEELAAMLEPFAPPRVQPVRRVSGTSSAALPASPSSSSSGVVAPITLSSGVVTAASSSGIVAAAGPPAAADEATTMNASGGIGSTTGAHVSHVSQVSQVEARRRGPWLIVGASVAAGAIVAAVAGGVWRVVHEPAAVQPSVESNAPASQPPAAPVPSAQATPAAVPPGLGAPTSALGPSASAVSAASAVPVASAATVTPTAPRPAPSPHHSTVTTPKRNPSTPSSHESTDPLDMNLK